MSSSPCLIGIDLGTSACKCAVIRSDGVLLASTSVPYPTHSPHPGWSEQDPADWYASAVAALREAFSGAQVPPSQVAAIGLSGQMHTTVFLDRHLQPLRPAIIWSDRRSVAQVEQVTHQISLERLIALTGNRLAAGFTLASWLWLREHEPSIYRGTHRLLFPKDVLRLYLTGEEGSEPSDASASLLFDPYQLAWSQALLEELDLDPGALPEIHASASTAGGLLAEAARETGLLAGTPVMYGGSDQSMQALGCAVITPGQISSAIGTGGQLFAPLASPMPDPQGRLHLFCHALPRLWHLEAAILSAGASLQWLRDALAPGVPFQILADPATTIPPGSDGLYFLPYLSGERTPYFQPDLHGVFAGLSLQHTRAHLVRAVMEGVVFAMRQGLDLIRALGIQPVELAATGAAAGHPLWLQLQADIFNLPVRITAAADAAATGAALLAGLGTGIFHDAKEACGVVSTTGPIVLPDPERWVIYDELFKGHVKLAESGLARLPHTGVGQDRL